MRYSICLLTALIAFSGCASKTQQDDIPDQQEQEVTYTINKDATIQDVRKRDYTGPYANTSKIYQNLNGAIIAISDQLFTTNVAKQVTSVILTSFVDLNQLNKTTTFGRLLGESMYNELHVRRFDVTDFRGQDAISVNADGEFHITRDTDKLKDHIAEIEHIVVGTYVKFENESVLINARILDSETGKVISTARIIYKPKDCRLFDICATKSGINIITDECSKVKCPTGQCVSGICE